MSVESVDWDDLRDAINDGTIEGDPHRDRLLALLASIKAELAETRRGESYWEDQAKRTRAELELAMRTIDRQNADLKELRLQRTASNQEGA